MSYYDPSEPAAVEFAGTPLGTALRASRGRIVTVEEVRAMAQYKLERRDVWDKFTSKQAAWKEFAERPEVCLLPRYPFGDCLTGHVQNKHRTLNAWYCVAINRVASGYPRSL